MDSLVPTNNSLDVRLNNDGGTGGILMLIFILPLFLLCSIGGERRRPTSYSTACTGACGILNPTVWAARVNMCAVLNAAICVVVTFYGYLGATLSLVSCAVGYYGVCFNDWRMVMVYGWVATALWFIVACATLTSLAEDISLCEETDATTVQWCGFLRFLVFVEVVQLVQCAVTAWCTFRFLYWVYRRRRAAHGQGFLKVNSVNRDVGKGDIPDIGEDLDLEEENEDDFGRPGPQRASDGASLVDDAYTDEYARPGDLPPLHRVSCEMIRNLLRAYNFGVAAAPGDASPMTPHRPSGRSSMDRSGGVSGSSFVGGGGGGSEGGGVGINTAGGDGVGAGVGAGAGGASNRTVRNDDVQLTVPDRMGDHETNLSDDDADGDESENSAVNRHAGSMGGGMVAMEVSDGIKKPKPASSSVVMPLPPPWQAVKAEDGEIYFWNKKTVRCMG